MGLKEVAPAPPPNKPNSPYMYTKKKVYAHLRVCSYIHPGNSFFVEHAIVTPSLEVEWKCVGRWFDSRHGTESPDISNELITSLYPCIKWKPGRIRRNTPLEYSPGSRACAPLFIFPYVPVLFSELFSLQLFFPFASAKISTDHFI